jgi:hypothetical protein
MLLAGTRHLQEAILQQRWLTTCDPEFWRGRIDEVNRPQHFPNAPVVINLARRL